ncbi:hypothetical protein RRG08_033786 [Elysia crispata]|uniref:Uncharacterized protein n=1 Tax=Elysia crispata TaxID=231223 RepID=A0AAE1EEL9_9GAST|nr:hypothetical protein RRG08_033786 [Elysia crispata]
MERNRPLQKRRKEDSPNYRTELGFTMREKQKNPQKQKEWLSLYARTSRDYIQKAFETYSDRVISCKSQTPRGATTNNSSLRSNYRLR